MGLIKKCNLCGFPIITLNKGVFGKRCIRCKSTYIHRAMGFVINELNLDRLIQAYELSSEGAWFSFLKKKYRNLVYSEYYNDVEPGKYKNGIQCQDVQNLQYRDSLFELVTCTEVFEHVPNDLQGFKEVYRVLKEGGYFLFTVPLIDNESTIERAIIKNGKTINILEPEYHGDKIRGRSNVLAFREYGRDIQIKLESVGFEAEIKNINSEKYAIYNGNVIFCRK